MTDIQPTDYEPHPLHTLVSWPAVIAGAVVAVAVGAVVASRAAKFTDHHRGTLTGLSVWAVAFLMAIFIAGSTAAGGLTAVLNGAAENADIDVDVATGPPPPVYYERGGPMVLVDPSNPPAGVLAPGPGDAGAAVAPAARPAAEKTADFTSQIALWAFLTMLLGAVGAVFGARYGAKRHGWEARMKMTDDPAVRAPSGGLT